ncbi:MAG TPA: NADH-quinone oxidoreductase subunit NuoK [bacterium]|nr:NADH-quinone oxidoreductase subunit NuoK [bacterium]
MTTLAHYITLSAILFAIGLTGVVCRRNALVIFMSIELMLNAANLAFIAFARHQGRTDGQVIAFFVIALAAAEVAVGLAIIVAIFRKQGTIDVGNMRFLKG